MTGDLSMDLMSLFLKSRSYVQFDQFIEVLYNLCSLDVLVAFKRDVDVVVSTLEYLLVLCRTSNTGLARM